MKINLSLLLISVIAIVAGCENKQAPNVETEQAVLTVEAPASEPSYIGNEQCAGCHQQQFEGWVGSHHDLAMQHANETSVLGNFNSKAFKYNNITTTFFRKNDQYFVSTDGPDGKLQDYQILYTFGVEPLQQYLIALPGGRLQALGIAWDTRLESQNGQKWFHLYPDDKLTFKDRLHWTKRDQNWNFMCAECHSTNLEKNYNLELDNYSTKWSEIDVSCEACHGPASNHLYWAQKKADWGKLIQKGLTINLDERIDVHWSINSETGNAKRSKIKSTDKEVEMCAQCHSRRSVISDKHQPGKPLMDSYRPAILEEFLYHPDGQVKEESYVYGSFVQSKMYHEGVTCSDCHNPHTLKLRVDGNGVCLQCHLSEKYDQSQHHFHQVGSEGALCAECHMPQTKYMLVDGRHDHSIRIPRPDLSETLNSPNSCNQCHTDKTNQWAASQMEKWYGEDWSPGWHFGETLKEARERKPGLGQDVAAVAASPKLPDIARATAANLLNYYPGPVTSLVAKKLLNDKSPEVRLSALLTLDSLPAEQRIQLGVGLLIDPVRAVRIEAARVLSLVPENALSAVQSKQLANAIDEYRQAQYANAERPQSHINLGLLSLRLQQYQQAEMHYQQALKLDSSFANAYVNLADLYRAQGLESEVKKVLDEAILAAPENAAVWHSSGLWLIRSKNLNKAIDDLKQAVELQTDNLRYRYVYAVALHENNKIKQSITELENLLSISPNNRDGLIALINYSQRAGDISKARLNAEKLFQVAPEYGTVEDILNYYK